MADTVVIRTEYDGFRNTIIRVSDVSDGTGLTNRKVFDATASGAFGVTVNGQTFYPGTNVQIIGLDYDVQDMKINLLWEATANESILALGSAPEDFWWQRFGGLKVPPGLVGATGSILVTTLNQAPNSTFSLLLYLRKNVPQS